MCFMTETKRTEVCVFLSYWFIVVEIHIVSRFRLGRIKTKIGDMITSRRVCFGTYM